MSMPNDRGVMNIDEVAMIAVDGVNHTYLHARTPALVDLSVTIPSGQIAALVGRNGAGKTTLLRIMTGLLRPTGRPHTKAGTVAIAGHLLYQGGARGREEMAAAKRMTGAVADQPPLYDRLTGREFIRFSAEFYSVARGAALEQRISELLVFFDLEDKADNRIGGYSLGMRKKTAVCAALVHNPRMLILDEPFDGLDPMSRLHLKDALRAQSRYGRAILLSTHGLEVAEDLSDRVLVLDQGRIIADGDMAHLRSITGSDDSDRLETVFLRLVGAKSDGYGGATESAALPAVAETDNDDARERGR